MMVVILLKPVCPVGGVRLYIRNKKILHPENAPEPMYVHAVRSPILVRDEQPLNALFPMDVHVERSPTLVRAWQYMNASFPMDVQAERPLTEVRA